MVLEAMEEYEISVEQVKSQPCGSVGNKVKHYNCYGSKTKFDDMLWLAGLLGASNMTLLCWEMSIFNSYVIRCNVKLAAMSGLDDSIHS